MYAYLTRTMKTTVNENSQYRLNGEIEYHDPAEPSTASCPLLPGQPLNVLDMPIQPTKSRTRNESSDSIDSIVFTLDPRDKYLPPGVRRAATTSAVEQKRLRLRSGTKRPASSSRQDSIVLEGPSPIPHSLDSDLVLERQRSLRNIFNKMRRTKSAGSDVKSTGSWHGKVFSRAGSSRKMLPSGDVVPTVPQVPAQFLNEPQPAIEYSSSIAARASQNSNEGRIASAGASADIQSETFAAAAVRNRTGQLPILSNQSQDIVMDKAGSIVAANSQIRTDLPSNNAAVQYDMTREDDCHRQESGEVRVDEDATPMREHPPKLLHRMTDQSLQEMCEGGIEAPSDARRDQSFAKHQSSEFSFSYSESHLSSYATEDNFSPGLASSAHSRPASPLHLSQPSTPAVSEFNDNEPVAWRESINLDLEQLSIAPPSRAPPPPPLPATHFASPPSADPSKPIYLPFSGFQGYSLSEHEHTSALTLRKPSSTTFSHRSERSGPQKDHKQEFVQSWNDGSGHRLTALEDLVGDLGYLGKLIV